MQKTTKSKLFIGAAIFLALLLTGCSSPAGGGNSGGNQDFTDYSVSEIDANSLYYIHKDSHNNVNGSVFSNSEWDVTYQGHSAGIIDEDPVFANWPQYGDALVDTHGKVVKLATHSTSSVFSDGNYHNVSGGNSALVIQEITVSEESALSFDYKCDLYYGYDEEGRVHINYLKVFIDNSTRPAFETYGSGQMWQNGSIVLSAGTHSVKFQAVADNYYGFYVTNAAYIDNITIAPNTVASVEIYPKGLQETYVNGDSIQFTAKALRSDGSTISGKEVTWATTGGTIDEKGLFTPGTSKGTFTVTANIDNNTASNKTIKVHGTDYIADPITINDHTFTGTITPIDNVYRSNTISITFEDPTPAYSNFITDGFFPMKGNSKDHYVFVRIYKCHDDGSPLKLGDWDYPYQSYYLMEPGNFEERIWLRFGDGDYEIWIFEVDAEHCENYDGYEGAIQSWQGTGPNGSSLADTYTVLHVKNQTGLNWSKDDCAFLFPSFYCQFDNYLISNAFNAIMAELPENAKLGQRLQALYNWEVHRSHYDFVSFSNNKSTNKRKKQDALHVLKYGMAVCEGYADLYTAFARLLGVSAAYQSSNNLCHAWTELKYNGDWKMVDITWDDPSTADTTQKYPTSENYTFFLIDPDDKSHAKRDSEGHTIEPYQYDRVTEYTRSAN